MSKIILSDFPNSDIINKLKFLCLYFDDVSVMCNNPIIKESFNETCDSLSKKPLNEYYNEDKDFQRAVIRELTKYVKNVDRNTISKFLYMFEPFYKKTTTELKRNMDDNLNNIFKASKYLEALSSSGYISLTEISNVSLTDLEFYKKLEDKSYLKKIANRASIEAKIWSYRELEEMNIIGNTLPVLLTKRVALTMTFLMIAAHTLGSYQHQCMGIPIYTGEPQLIKILQHLSPTVIQPNTVDNTHSISLAEEVFNIELPFFPNLTFEEIFEKREKFKGLNDDFHGYMDEVSSELIGIDCTDKNYKQYILKIKKQKIDPLIRQFEKNKKAGIITGRDTMLSNIATLGSFLTMTSGDSYLAVAAFFSTAMSSTYLKYRDIKNYQNSLDQNSIAYLCNIKNEYK